MAGITREAARTGVVPREKVAATATIPRRLLAAIPSDGRGPGGLAALRDRALLLVGFAGAPRRAELASIRFDHLEKTDRGIRLTLPRTEGEQTDAVTVPLPYGDTDLCPIHALEAWQRTAEQALTAVIQEAHVQGISTRGVDDPTSPISSRESFRSR